MKKIITVFTIVLLIVTSSVSSFANSNLVEISSKNISNFDSELAKPLDPKKMSKFQKEKYYEAIEKQVKKAEKDGIDPIKFRKTLVTLLEENKLVVDNPNSYYTDQIIMPKGGSWVPDVHISNRIVGAAIEVVVTGAIAGFGVASVKALVKKVGKRETRKIFTRTIKSKLIAWGAETLITYHIIDSAADFIFEYMDWGSKIADYLDSKDDVPNNGYLDVIW